MNNLNISIGGQLWWEFVKEEAGSSQVAYCKLLRLHKLCVVDALPTLRSSSGRPSESPQQLEYGTTYCISFFFTNSSVFLPMKTPVHPGISQLNLHGSNGINWLLSNPYIEDEIIKWTNCMATFSRIFIAIYIMYKMVGGTVL